MRTITALFILTLASSASFAQDACTEHCFRLTDNASPPDAQTITRLSDNAAIPPDPANADRQRFNVWLATGCNGGPCTPDPYVAPPAPPPSSISRPQFYQQLAVAGIISQDEALGALAGVLPPPLATLVAQLPDELQFRAKMKLLGAQNFEIADPVTQGLAALAQANGIPIELGQFFTDAAKL